MKMEQQMKVVVDELHKPARRNYLRRKYDIRGMDETWQADLVEMQSYARENKGYRYMLTVIDIFSKYSWAIPVKKKTGEDVTAAMKSVLRESGRVPKNLHTDRGNEFYNKNFQALMTKYGINLYSTYSNLKASICERFNRTLKNEMWKKFSLRGNYKWLDILPDLLTAYNERKHRTTGMKPKDVTKSCESSVRQKFATVMLKKKPKFHVGDKVRMSKVKQVFEKGYTPNWSTEIFSITKVASTNPVTYHLKDYREQPISGGLYEEELQKVKYPDVYLVEKIVKKRGNEVYVKWLGFDSSHNSWIDKSNL